MLDTAVFLQTVGSEVLAAHPDWITATAKDPDKRERLRGLCIDRIQHEHHNGGEWRQWSWQGFEGVSCGQLTFGDRERDDCTIVRVSGGLAGSIWREVSANTDNCSRLDLAVTVRLDRYIGDVAALGYQQACKAARDRGTELHVSLIVSNHGGGTCYLGSRKSELFGRLYDKERESGDGAYRNCWRWELETKGRRALTYLHQLAIGGDERPHIQQTVCTYFTERGVTLPWDGGAPCALRGPVLVETDDDRRLAWLADQVQGSIRGLIGRGHRAAVLEALGLSRDGDRPLKDAIGAPMGAIAVNQVQMKV
jgi:hypothetical protein